MVSVRSSLAKRNAGGPRFTYIPQRILVEVGQETSISDIANSTDEITDEVTDTLPVDDTVLDTVSDELQELSFKTKILRNTGVIVAETDRITTVIENIKSSTDKFSEDIINDITKLRNKAENSKPVSVLGGFRPGLFNFEDPNVEANIRNDLLGEIKNPITDAVEELSGVVNAEVSYTVNTPGPRNLGIDVSDTGLDVLSGNSNKPDLGDAIKKINADKAWQVDTGSNAVVAIFDTSFSKDFVDSSRVIDTFSGDDVESAYSTPKEGHGTMTAYSAGGKAEETVGEDGEDKVSYNGVAKDADLLLARLTDSSGAMVYTVEAWDWLASWVKSLDKPVISNHSYGIPLCSARGQGLCSSIETNISKALSKRSDHQAVYAAGNEAQYCGHRLSGITNAISGANSDPSSIAVAAFRFDGSGAQTYSSHGFGTCSSVTENPKPDIGSLIPSVVPYGNKVKDLSTSNGGSGAGTSEAAPLTAGVATLVASITGNARQSVIEGILESTAKLPRRTQVNVVRGHDARFGNGQIKADTAVRRAKVLEEEKPPNAVFTFQPAEPSIGDQVTFNASASTDPNNDIERFEWDFGDGNTATGETVSHTFDDFGSSTVILTVTDSTDRQGTDSSEIYISAEPDAQFTVSPDTPRVGQTVTLDATSTVDPDQDIEEYRWNLGDGSVVTGEVVEYQYDNAGDYTVELTTTDSVGNTDSASQTVTVSTPPDPEFTIAPDNPVENERVTFNASGSSDPERDIVAYRWNLGDGTSASGSIVENAYAQYGEYEVTLQVEDSQNNVSQTTARLDVDAMPEADIEYEPSGPIASDTITFSAGQSVDPDAEIVDYSWDFGNGESESGETVEHRYGGSGEYTVTLTVEDKDGYTDMESETIVVTSSPVADFSVNQDSPLQGTPITFDATESTDPDGDIETYSWDFGDGNVTVGSNVQHTYNEHGMYQVTLTVTDSVGNTSSITKEVQVTARPEPEFSYTPGQPTTSDAVQFDASASTDPDDSIAAYTWEFGNGETGIGEVVEQMYGEASTYNVILTVEDEAGNTESVTKTITVSETSGTGTGS